MTNYLDLLNNHHTDLVDIICDLGLEDAVAHAMDLSWCAGLRPTVEEVETMLSEWRDVAEYGDGGADDWAEARGFELMEKVA